MVLHLGLSWEDGPGTNGCASQKGREGVPDVVAVLRGNVDDKNLVVTELAPQVLYLVLVLVLEAQARLARDTDAMV